MRGSRSFVVMSVPVSMHFEVASVRMRTASSVISPASRIAHTRVLKARISSTLNIRSSVSQIAGTPS